MNALLSVGVIAFAYVVGRRILEGGTAATGVELRRSALEQVLLALVLGVALLTPALVVVAWLGLFEISTLGIVGWGGAAIGLWRRPLRVSGGRSFDLVDAIALLAAALFAMAAVSGRDETLGAGRDQQVYAESAVALSMRGHASASYTFLDDADRSLLRSLGGVRVLGLTRLHNGVDQPIRTTHPLGWPVWLSFAHASAGIEGLYAANAVVFAFGALLFFVLLRRLVPPGIALAATCVFLALPSSLWIAGISLSEPLAMTLLLAIPLVGNAGLDRSRWKIAALLAAASLVRMDSALLVPASIAAAVFACVAASTPRAVSAARRFALTQLGCFAMVLLVYRAFFPGYLNSVLQEVAAIAAASLALTVSSAFLTPSTVGRLRRMIAAPQSRVIAMAILVVLFIYAAAVRPTLQPYSVIRQASGLNGQRDFREVSLVNLATYVSWPMLLFALGGVCYAIQRNWVGKAGLFRCLLLVIAVGPALLYLWSPQVSPDHPWAVRRFVPTIVPYVVLFAGLFIHALTRRIGRLSTAAGALVLVAPYTLVAWTYPPQQALVRENKGISDQLVTIARELPDALIVDIGADEEVADALFIAFGKPVAIVEGGVANKANIERVTAWMRAKSKHGHPAWLLHGPQLWRTGADISDRRRWTITRRYLKPSTHPPVTDITTSQSELILSQLDRLDPAFATRMFGGERIWGARDGGFFESEVAPFGQFRYTDGRAWIDVPAKALRGAEALKVDVFSYAKRDVSRWISIIVDGRPAWTGRVGPGISTLRVPVSEATTDDVARIEILSQAVDPAEMNADDPRADLSIGLIGIRPLHAGEPKKSGSGIQGFRSRLALIGASAEPQRISTGQTADFVLDVTNSGTEFWPTVRELGGPERAVQIALRWYRRGKSDGFVGDNRWSLSISMLPGDRTRLLVPLAPIGLDGKPLPAGEYDVHVGMVRETVALFADNGDAVLSIPVVLTQ